MISVLSVRTVQRKASSSGGRLTAFSYSSDGFVGHYVSVLFERTASRMYRPVSIWEELNAYYYSGDLQIATSRRILFLTFFGNVFR